jgi:hypothetical protein
MAAAAAADYVRLADFPRRLQHYIKQSKMYVRGFLVGTKADSFKNGRAELQSILSMNKE